MRPSFPAFVLAGAFAFASTFASSGCYSKRIPKGGKPFNYDNHAKIQRSRTTRHQAQALFGTEPVRQGRDGDLFFDVYRYEEVRTSGSYVVPGSSKVEAYLREAIVYYDIDNQVVRLELKSKGED